MAPCVAGKFPAVCLHGVGHFLGFGTFCFKVKIRMLLQPFFLICIDVVWHGLVADVCAVAQHAVIAGQRDCAFRPPVRSVWMLFDKLIHQRHNVIIPYHGSPIVLDVLAFRLAVFIQHHFGGIAIPIVAVVIRQVV